jgi:hypothetical protein
LLTGTWGTRLTCGSCGFTDEPPVFLERIPVGRPVSYIRDAEQAAFGPELKRSHISLSGRHVKAGGVLIFWNMRRAENMSVHDIDGAPVHRLNYNGLLILTEDFAHGGGDFAYGGVAFYGF